MQPLRLVLPRLFTTFHVTKSGNSSSSVVSFLFRDRRFGNENKEDRDDEFDAAEDVVLSDGVLEDADGADEEEEGPEDLLRSRLMAAGLYGGVSEFSVAGGLVISSISWSLLGFNCVSSSLLSYCAQFSSTCCRESGFRFSRLLDKHSKQYAQWA